MDQLNKIFSVEKTKAGVVLNIANREGEIISLPVGNQIERFLPGQFIFHEQNTADGLYFILEGYVKVFKNDTYKDQIVRLSKSGDILGHRGIGKKKFPVSAMALTETTVVFIEMKSFFDLLYSQAAFAVSLLSWFAEELDFEENKLRDFSNYSVFEKGKKALLLVAHYFGLDEHNHIRHIDKLTRKDLGDLVGLTANQISKVLKGLSIDNIIHLEDGKVKVLKADKLQL
ncbi:MAG: Crp/Fnr family transcriptional regulator [Crocinitomicaceae bacterium]|nr:Crp/Fnr family transcriptional regulator [Crocinitomicaceae bacterium]